MSADTEGPVGQIPQSSGLLEASAESLTELMSRDPEGYSRQDRKRIVEALRADRAKREKMAEELAATGGKRPKAKAAKITAMNAKIGSSQTTDDLGL